MEEIDPKDTISETPVPTFRIYEDTVEVIVNDNKFIFKIPTIRQISRIAQKAKAMRIKDSDGGDGSESGLSFYEIIMYRAMANFEELLVSSDDSRFFSEDPVSKKPVVVSDKWPLSITEDYILEVYDGLLAAINSFRAGSGIQQ